MELSSIISSLVGGVLALVGVWISNRRAVKKEYDFWKLEKKYTLYVETIGILNSLDIPCLATEKAIEKKEIVLNIDELNLWLDTLHTYLEEKNALLFLFLPKGLYSDMVRLNSDVYKITSNIDLHSFSINELKQSPIYEAIMSASKIANKLKKDLLPDKRCFSSKFRTFLKKR